MENLDREQLGRVTSRFPNSQSSARLDNYANDRFIAGKPENETHVPIILERGAGPSVWDVDGNRYLDFCNSLNLPFGHSLDELPQECSLLNSGNYMTPQRLALAHELGEQFPGLSGFQFRSSGAESVEAAIRYAKACHRSGLTVVAIAGAYHGLTLAAQQAMGTVAGAHQTVILPFPEGDGEQAARDMLTRHAEAAPVAFIFETVQGATLRHLPPTFLEFVVRLKSTRNQDVLLLCDDMLASVRCGFWCSVEKWMEPDLLVTGKSWSGGFPFSLFGVTAEVRAMAGDILGTTTYGGNPLACEAALRTIRRLRQESIITLIRQKEAYIRAEFLSRWLKCPGVHRASCFGLLFGVIMRSVDEATLTAVRLLRRGVLCARIGSLLRFSPPLNITQEVLDEALNMITECLSVIPTRRNAVE